MWLSIAKIAIAASSFVRYLPIASKLRPLVARPSKSAVHLMDRTLKLALGSIAVGVLVLGLKYLAYRLTGSIALYSDALESIINVATAILAFFAVRLSAVPPDANH